MDELKLGALTLTWLKGGTIHLDGGAMFGPVPKPLWSKRYPPNEKNQIEQRTDPIYCEIQDKKIIIESGIGNGKLTEKQKRNFGCTEESQIESSLKKLGTKPEDIDYVILTHMHFDHSCGLTKMEDGTYSPVFPTAKVIVSQQEWTNVQNANIRTEKSYWRQNWEPVSHQIKTFEKTWEELPGLKVIKTGGHTSGYSIVVIESENEKCIHLGDLLATHAHFPTLWVSAYDDFPIDSVHIKEEWTQKGIRNNAWFIFYHDAFYRAVKWDQEGNIISEVKCSS